MIISSIIHPDEAIERHLDDTPRVCLALPQRPFGLPGKRTLVLGMPIFPLRAVHGPHQESKRWNHHDAACQAKLPEDFSNRRQDIVTIHAHQHRPMHAFKVAKTLGPGIAGDHWHTAMLVLLLNVTGQRPFA